MSGGVPQGLGRAVRAATVLLLAGFAAWGAGLAWFIHRATEPAGPPAQTDGIVAFTGGAERVETALRLLAEGRARALLISGIGGGADLPALARLAGVAPEPLAGRVTLGREAVSTHTNATETAAWARAHAISSLMVVTAGYHMPRAMTELARALPGVALYPVPVLPPALRGPGLHDAATLRLMAEEYTKWLATAFHLAGLGAALDPTGAWSRRAITA
jgi:uncharacterized SAM-binding protein YcdF (DUF218 family)